MVVLPESLDPLKAELDPEEEPESADDPVTEGADGLHRERPVPTAAA